METIHWELTVLSKAIAFPNLSTAAVHVRLSQPQLSRIIQKIERELGVNLLDRSSKRKAAWTPVARSIAESVERSNRSLSESLQRVLMDRTITHLHVGTLEGLSHHASLLCSQAFKALPLNIAEIEVLDLGFLEETFLRGAYDLVFTSREPGARKFPRIVQIGYQIVENRNADAEIQVMSPFEAGRLLQMRKHPKKKEPAGQVLPGAGASKKVISNALDVRRFWVDELGAAGLVPTPVFKKKKAGKLEDVFVIGSDHLSEKDWETLKALLEKL